MSTIYIQNQIIQIYILSNVQKKNMRHSPINHIKNTRQREYRDSPYSSVINTRSPAKQNDPSEADYWRRRAKELEADILGLNEEVMFLNRKLEKLDELEEKIEVLLAQNSHLVDENESLIRLIQQKKSDAQMWKARFEGEHSNANLAEVEKKKIFDHLNIKDQEHQVQVDKLLAQISRLHDQQENLETLKQIEINQIKSKYENQALNQIQNLKRSQYGNNELHELNAKKLRDTIEQKDYEIETLRRESALENERLNGQISFLKNEIRKVDQQKAHQLELLRTEHENTKGNLLRAHKKNEEQLRNLQQAKNRRLHHELEQKKNEIEDLFGKAKRSGKQNQAQLNNLVGEKAKLRIEIKQSDNRNKSRIDELTTFYENLLEDLRNNSHDKEKNLISYYDTETGTLKQVIAAKQQQIERLLQLNKGLKENQQERLLNIKSNNEELKNKIIQIVKHYERQVQLLKIKISQLYQADIQSLRSLIRNSFASHNRETENLIKMLDDERKKLAQAVQDKINLRIDYQNRLNQFKVIHDRDLQQMRDLIALHEKSYENQTSKGTAAHISHNDVLQKQNQNQKSMVNQKRTLEKQIQNKNKQIESLNLKIQKLEGFHKREIEKLEQEIVKLKNTHQDWVDKQIEENQEWNRQRGELKERAHQLDLKMKRQADAHETKEAEFRRDLEKLKLENAQLRGLIQELNSKVGVLGSDLKIAAEGAEKTRMQHQSHLNTERDKYDQAKVRDRSLREDQYSRNLRKLKQEIEDLRKQNEILRDNEHQWKIREADLRSQIGSLLDSLNKRAQLEEHVINIGLSNNYMKNVAEIYKKTISE